MTAERLADIRSDISAGNFSKALNAAQAELELAPENSELLYMAAVSSRYLSQFDQALAQLARLKSITPEYGRAYQEEGHVYRATGQDTLALGSYRQAGQLNPSLTASFRGQLEILLALGHGQPAAAVRRQLEHLLKTPKPLLAVMDLIAEGKLLKAEDLCRAFLKKVPHHPEAVRLLAEIGVKLGVLDDADFLLESLVLMSPDNNRARMDYIQVLRKQQKYAAALVQAKTLLERDPGNPQFRSLVAIEQMQTGDFDDALVNFDRVLEQVPGDAITLTSKGHALKTMGNSSEAINAYRQAIESRSDHGEAYYSLANLKTYPFGDAELKRMLAAEQSSGLLVTDRIYLYFALAKAFEDQADFERAFDYYQQGNHLKQAQSRYDADKMSAEMQAHIDVCGEELFRQETGCDAPDPIFIVGLPRAGSTLLEQILSSHSQVDGTMELPNILSLAHRLRRESGEYPQTLFDLDKSTLRELGEAYIRDTRVHRQGAPYFIDKMPNNFRHIGLIRLILPNAKIIDARRHPLSCCFSGFKQLFAEGQEFSYSLSNIGLYYRDYVNLMDHWHRVLPGAVLQVQHEDVVADLETQVRRMLEYCGLPFEQACVDFHKTERLVRTPSSEQVRQPIFSSSLEQWRNFAAHLAPLNVALGDDIMSRYPNSQPAP